MTSIKAADEKFCGDCGAIIKAKAEVCPKCGVRQLPVPNPLSRFGAKWKKPDSSSVTGFLSGWLWCP